MELLVVVAVIVVLIALLVPALDKAVEAAQRAVCGANLHTWGTGHGLYYMDNKRSLLEPARIYADVQHGGDGWVYSSVAWVWSQPDKAGRTGQWSAQAYVDYVSALNTKVPPARGQTAYTSATGNVSTNEVGTGSASKVFLCPSNARFQQMVNRNNSAASKPPGPTKGAGDTAPDEGGPTIEGDYAYFARVNKWRTTSGDATGAVNAANAGGGVRAPWPEDLVDRQLSGAKLLMNCKVRLDSGGWQGNGSSYHHGDLPVGGTPYIAGSNQLYGDGGVTWFGADYFNSDSPDMYASGGTGGDADPPGTKKGLPRYINGAALYGNNAYTPYYFYATSTK